MGTRGGGDVLGEFDGKVCHWSGVVLNIRSSDAIFFPDRFVLFCGSLTLSRNQQDDFEMLRVFRPMVHLTVLAAFSCSAVLRMLQRCDKRRFSFWK